MRTWMVSLLLVGCGTADTERLGVGPAPDVGGVVDAPDASTPDARPDAGGEASIQCGAGVACGPGEVCATYAEGDARCFTRGEEPSFENGAPDWPWPALLLYCDDDEDCPGTTRCVLNVGEIFRADCREEDEHCGIHFGHLCSSEMDCHSCPNPGDRDRPTTCRPVNLSGATHLSSCTWSN